MKLIIRSLLALTLALSSGCATYKHIQRTRPAAVQTKAQSLGILQIRASGDSSEQSLMAGIDLTKVNASTFEILKEDPIGSFKAIGLDTLLAGGVALGGKWLNDKYNITGGGGDKQEINPNTINASNGGNIQINGAPSDSYKNHALNANGPGSNININFNDPNRDAAIPSFGAENE